MEISALEIKLLCERIAESVEDYFVSGIYSIEGGILLRLNHSEKPEKLIAVSSFAPWITTKNLSDARASKFVTQIRDFIERDVIRSVQQVGNERIAKLDFSGRKGEKSVLYAEFFSRGNLVLTEAEQSDRIVAVENPQTFRHRSLVPGEKYELPPSRGVALEGVNFDKLVEMYNRDKNLKEAESFSAIKWFGRNVATSRKFVEEVFDIAKVNKETPIGSLQLVQLERISDAIRELIDRLQKSQAGYILLPSEASQIDVDVCPIIPLAWKIYEQKGLATVESFPSLNEALDEVQIKALVLQKKREASSLARAKFEELSSAIQKQEQLVSRNRDLASDLRKIASSLMSAETVDDIELATVSEKLIANGLAESSPHGKENAQFVYEPRVFISTLSSRGLASRLFDEAKRMDATNLRLFDVMSSLSSQRDELLRQRQSIEDKAEKRIVTERRERQWFERYRWFVASNGHLALGGRDSTSNSIVINKYSSEFDVIFHADLHGSPFFVLKGSNLDGPLSDELALELSQATVSFSRAWKDNLGSADAYWVKPDQIKKGAPSGEYLPRGSFFIEGKKNFVRHVKVELSVGLTTSSRLPLREQPNETAAGIESQEENEIVRPSESVICVCGPQRALSSYCFSIVTIAPGDQKGSEFSKRLKQYLVKRTNDERLRESSKKIQIDDIMRVLPSGSYKVVSEKQDY